MSFEAYALATLRHVHTDNTIYLLHGWCGAHYNLIDMRPPKQRGRGGARASA